YGVSDPVTSSSLLSRFLTSSSGARRDLRSFPTRRSSDLTAAHAGNGFLMRHGYTIVWVAWQGDILRGDDRMVLDLPVATDNGERSEEHTSELQSRENLVCRLLLEKKNHQARRRGRARQPP